MSRCDERAERISVAARDRKLTIATAESLTGGRISAVLGAAPSSSEWYRGSIVAYASSVKHGLLQVPDGPVVSEPSARAMVTSVAELLGADLAVAVTGAGGPQSQDGQPPGTVWFGSSPTVPLAPSCGTSMEIPATWWRRLPPMPCSCSRTHCADRCGRPCGFGPDALCVIPDPAPPRRGPGMPLRGTRHPCTWRICIQNT